MRISNIVRKFKSQVENILAENLKNVYWFGSSINRSRFSENSDIDLLIETESPVTDSQRDQIADAAIDLCAETGIVLDVHYYTSREISTSPYSHSPFIESITQEGVHV